MDQTINPLTQHTVSTVTIRNCSPYAIQIYWLFSWFFEKGLKQHFGKLNSYLSHPKYFTYHDALESSQLMISATCSPLTHTHTCTHIHAHTCTHTHTHGWNLWRLISPKLLSFSCMDIAAKDCGAWELILLLLTI